MDDAPRNIGRLLYDGNCTFCFRAVSLLRAWAGPNVEIDAQANQLLSDDDLEKLGTNRRACDESLQFIDSSGHVFSGADAVNAILETGPQLRDAIRILRGISVFLSIERLVYRWVASNRPFVSSIVTRVVGR